MQSLSPEQYERLRRLAVAWQRHQGEALKGMAGYNPRLAVDALCFQALEATSPDGTEAAYLAGALVTPVSLSLVLVPVEEAAVPPESSERQRFTLPSGRYPFTAECLADSLWLWRCELLDDLSDLDSMQEASRLAQQLMERVMTPET